MSHSNGLTGILFLGGYTAADLDKIEDTVPEIITEAVSTQDNKYGNIPKYYYNYATWIKSTGISCWYCSCGIHNVPWFMPKAMVSRPIPAKVMNSLNTHNIGELANYTSTVMSASMSGSANGKTVDVQLIATEGLFCSPFCVVSYVKLYHSESVSYNEIEHMLLRIYREFTGSHIDHIPEAENRFILKKFCGDSGKTESEYFKLNHLKVGCTNIF